MKVFKEYLIAAVAVFLGITLISCLTFKRIKDVEKIDGPVQVKNINAITWLPVQIGEFFGLAEDARTSKSNMGLL